MLQNRRNRVVTGKPVVTRFLRFRSFVDCLEIRIKYGIFDNYATRNATRNSLYLSGQSGSFLKLLQHVLYLLRIIKGKGSLPYLLPHITYVFQSFFKITI